MPEREKKGNKQTMNVEIKQIIADATGSVFLYLQCTEPHQKEIPRSKGQEELDRNNKLFQIASEEYHQEMTEFRKRTQKLHLGIAQLSQDEDDNDR